MDVEIYTDGVCDLHVWLIYDDRRYVFPPKSFNDKTDVDAPHGDDVCRITHDVSEMMLKSDALCIQRINQTQYNGSTIGTSGGGAVVPLQCIAERFSQGFDTLVVDLIDNDVEETYRPKSHSTATIRVTNMPRPPPNPGYTEFFGKLRHTLMAEMALQNDYNGFRGSSGVVPATEYMDRMGPNNAHTTCVPPLPLALWKHPRKCKASEAYLLRALQFVVHANGLTDSLFAKMMVTVATNYTSTLLTNRVLDIMCEYITVFANTYRYSPDIAVVDGRFVEVESHNLIGNDRSINNGDCEDLDQYTAIVISALRHVETNNPMLLAVRGVLDQYHAVSLYLTVTGTHAANIPSDIAHEHPYGDTIDNVGGHACSMLIPVDKYTHMLNEYGPDQHGTCKHGASKHGASKRDSRKGKSVKGRSGKGGPGKRPQKKRVHSNNLPILLLESTGSIGGLHYSAMSDGYREWITRDRQCLARESSALGDVGFTMRALLDSDCPANTYMHNFYGIVSLVYDCEYHPDIVDTFVDKNGTKRLRNVLYVERHEEGHVMHGASVSEIMRTPDIIRLVPAKTCMDPETARHALRYTMSTYPTALNPDWHAQKPTARGPSCGNISLYSGPNGPGIWDVPDMDPTMSSHTGGAPGRVSNEECPLDLSSINDAIDRAINNPGDDDRQTCDNTSGSRGGKTHGRGKDNRSGRRKQSGKGSNMDGRGGRIITKNSTSDGDGMPVFTEPLPAMTQPLELNMPIVSLSGVSQGPVKNNAANDVDESPPPYHTRMKDGEVALEKNHVVWFGFKDTINIPELAKVLDNLPVGTQSYSRTMKYANGREMIYITIYHE